MSNIVNFCNSSQASAYFQRLFDGGDFAMLREAVRAGFNLLDTTYTSHPDHLVRSEKVLQLMIQEGFPINRSCCELPGSQAKATFLDWVLRVGDLSTIRLLPTGSVDQNKPTCVLYDALKAALRQHSETDEIAEIFAVLQQCGIKKLTWRYAADEPIFVSFCRLARNHRVLTQVLESWPDDELSAADASSLRRRATRHQLHDFSSVAVRLFNSNKLRTELQNKTIRSTLIARLAQNPDILDLVLDGAIELDNKIFDGPSENLV